jgi:hypothetical protein
MGEGFDERLLTPSAALPRPEPPRGSGRVLFIALLPPNLSNMISCRRACMRGFFLEGRRPSKPPAMHTMQAEFI